MQYLYFFISIVYISSIIYISDSDLIYSISHEYFELYTYIPAIFFLVVLLFLRNRIQRKQAVYSELVFIYFYIYTFVSIIGSLGINNLNNYVVIYTVLIFLLLFIHLWIILRKPAISEEKRILYKKLLFEYLKFRKIHGDKLKQLAKNKFLGEIILDGEKFHFWPHGAGVTCTDIEKDIEISFDFDGEKNLFCIDFWKFHLFVDSYIIYNNIQYFSPDKDIRDLEYEKCREYLVLQSRIFVRDRKYYVHTNAIK